MKYPRVGLDHGQFMFQTQIRLYVSHVNEGQTISLWGGGSQKRDSVKKEDYLCSVLSLGTQFSIILCTVFRMPLVAVKFFLARTKFTKTAQLQ